MQGAKYPTEFPDDYFERSLNQPKLRGPSYWTSRVQLDADGQRLPPEVVAVEYGLPANSGVQQSAMQHTVEFTQSPALISTRDRDQANEDDYNSPFLFHAASSNAEKPVTFEDFMHQRKADAKKIEYLEEKLSALTLAMTDPEPFLAENRKLKLENIALHEKLAKVVQGGAKIEGEFDDQSAIEGTIYGATQKLYSDFCDLGHVGLLTVTIVIFLAGNAGSVWFRGNPKFHPFSRIIAFFLITRYVADLTNNGSPCLGG